MSDLTLTLVQSELIWENPEANRDRFWKRLQSLVGATDLVILPEMFTTGFTMNAGPWAETMEGSTLDWMLALSRKLKADVTGSVIIREGGNFYNRLLWAKSDGQHFTYDKKHLFRMSGEHEVYAAGQNLLTVGVNDWRVRPFICYDLRFPLWCRNQKMTYDLALFVANWPAARELHWRILLRARAIENLCYVAGVNRVGTDGNGRTYQGDSTVIDSRGALLYHCKEQEDVFTITLSREELDTYREAFPAWKDADA